MKIWNFFSGGCSGGTDVTLHMLILDLEKIMGMEKLLGMEKMVEIKMMERVRMTREDGALSLTGRIKS